MITIQIIEKSKYFFLFFLFIQLSFSNFGKFTIDSDCESSLEQFPGKYSKELVKKTCKHSAVLNSCFSQVDKSPIFHFDKFGKDRFSKRILVFGLFHGDEFPAGSLARFWMNRLSKINPRSTWRVVPIVNPDGLKRKTRFNARGVDLNRNLPTEKWNQLAHAHWKKKEKMNKRRFPGPLKGSEQETKCVLNQIENFRPDFIVSIHTPYGLLDFDGPKEKLKPIISKLPAKSLGHYPGSLGRYMWAERSIPVLTIEMKGNVLNLSNKQMSLLQDEISSLAMKINYSTFRK